MSADDVVRALAAASGSPWAALAAKATLAMCASLALLRASRRASASTRHLLTAATFAALLLMPLVATLAPVRAVAVRATRPAPRVPAAAAGVSNAASVGGAPGPTIVRKDRVTRPALAAVYLGGAAFLLLRLATGIGRLFRLRARAEVSVTGTRLANELARRETGKDGVEVLTTPELAVPLTFGWSRPVILLPAETAAWTEEEMMRALRHEIEHVARGDWATQVLSRVALAVYWIHPLAWVLWRRLRLEAERACDDAVVRSQGQAETYAEQLVALARRVSGRGQVPALAMATRGNLGRRVESILAPGLRRTPRSRLATAASLALVLVGVGALAPLRLTIASADDQRTIEQALERSLAVQLDDDDDRDVDQDDDDSLDMRLLKASERGSLGAMRTLLDAGAHADAALAGDGSPLIAASRRGQVQAMELLIGSGADVNRGVEGDGSPLIAAARGGHADAVRLLLGRGAAIDAGVPGDGNALIMAAGAGHADVVSLLLDQGAGIETVVPGDENALIHACESGQARVVRLLIERGANVNARVEALGPDRRREWRTPLSMARRNGHQDVVRILQAAGARE
jgi:beta-lactamase regulating signal transducer with metallopeptidase domain/ankyrin repeat protein